MNNLHVKTGDNVMIISGKDKGKTGKVLQTSPKEGKVIVEGLNMVTKHVKPRRQGEQGGIVKAEGAIYACKVCAAIRRNTRFLFTCLIDCKFISVIKRINPFSNIFLQNHHITQLLFWQ